jgi:uncharacterized protein (TIGR01777 family)
VRILVTGSSGLIGSHLIPFLEKEGNDVDRLVRNRNKIDDKNLFWDPEKEILDVHSIENYQVVIHLAGENISSHRWSKNHKEKIRESRIKGTRLLVERLKKTKLLPHLLICASAIGYYGNRGKEMLTETSHKGDGFLADLGGEWEDMSATAKDARVRVVTLRTGVVLSKSSGALVKMLLPFKLGLGSIVGDGNQYLPWISIDDVTGVIDFIIKNEEISGAVNVVAPETVTNYEYSKALGRALSRPVFFKVPVSLLKLVLGEMAEQLLLSSSRVVPKVLIDHGYKFVHENIDQALAAVLDDK